MDTPEERLLSEAGRVPRRQVSQRRVTGRCCLIVLSILGAIIWIPILFFVGKFSYKFVLDLRSPHAYLASQNGTVRPLIDSTSRFDVLATVWLDVTRHLEGGHAIPKEFEVVHYTQPDGFNRSEAILYSGLLFRNVTMASRLHSSQVISFPVEPLYTQAIGASTLRAALQIIPHSIRTSLRFKDSDLVYPHYLPMGPRSPGSYMLTGEKGPRTLEQALERSAVNINLIKLLPTEWRSNSTTPNLRRDFGNDSPLLDGAPSNRRFSTGSAGLTVDNSHRIRLPHLQTRSRVILVKEEQRFPLVEYLIRRREWVDTYRVDCKHFRNGTQSSLLPSDGNCQRQTRSSIFENKLHFASEDGASEQTFYAPYLAQSVSASAYRHLRTIPRFEPQSVPLESLPSRSWKEDLDQCLIPMLETNDDSKRIYHFYWDVFFSSHEHLRSTTAENAYQHHYPAMKDWDDEDKSEIRVKTIFQENLNWGLQATGLGDREHPNSKPYFHAFRLVFFTLWLFVEQCLSALYWYTRATSHGLSWKSQWLSLMAAIFQVTSELSSFTKESIRSFGVLFQVLDVACIMVPAYLQLSTMLHFDINRSDGLIRRKAMKKERDSRRLDDLKISWSIPIGLALAHLILVRYTSSFDKHLTSPQGCQDNGSNPDAYENSYIIFNQLGVSLSIGSVLTQILFNYQMSTFAGSFKLTAIASFFILTFTLVVEQVESLSGWQPSRLPVVVGEVFQLVIASIMAFQAVFYSGIPQAVEANDEGIELT